MAGFVDSAHVEGDILVQYEGTGGDSSSAPARSRTKTPLPKKLVGVVFQDDMMLPALTVFETIKFAADLRMSRNASETERRDACEAILEQLGLSHIKEALVGGAATRSPLREPPARRDRQRCLLRPPPR